MKQFSEETRKKMSQSAKKRCELVLTVNEHHRLHSAVTKGMVDEILLTRIRELEDELKQLRFGGE